MTPESPARTTAPAYSERLSLTWWMWPVALIVVSILAFEVLLGFHGLPTWAPFAVLIPLTVAGMLCTGRLRIAVTGGEFQVDDARLPVRFVKDVVALANRWEELGEGERFAVLQQAASVLRTGLTNDVESRLR